MAPANDFFGYTCQKWEESLILENLNIRTVKIRALVLEKMKVFKEAGSAFLKIDWVLL
jgi:NAD dependent epimerase/dehydratase family enzyme